MRQNVFGSTRGVKMSLEMDTAPQFKTWTRMFAFHIALITLEKIEIQLFFLQLRVK